MSCSVHGAGWQLDRAELAASRTGMRCVHQQMQRQQQLSATPEVKKAESCGTGQHCQP
jgi:hypothetical protein